MSMPTPPILDQASDFDLVLYYGLNDPQLEIFSDVGEGLLQPRRTLAFYSDFGAGIVERENYPNAVTQDIFIRLGVAEHFARRNVEVSDGTTPGTVDRRVAVSQTSVSIARSAGNLDVGVIYIPFSNFNQPRTIAVPFQ